MYFNWTPDTWKYLLMLFGLLILFAWVWYILCHIGGVLIGSWLFFGTILTVGGGSVVPELFCIGAVSVIACFVYWCGLDTRYNSQYYIDRTKEQRKEEEEYGIIDFTEKDK